MFISCSKEIIHSQSSDQDEVICELSQKLERYRYTPLRSDERLHRSNEDSAAEMMSALQNCDAIIPIVTVGYVQTLQCLREIFYASQLGKEIFPVLVDEVEVVRLEPAGSWIESLLMKRAQFAVSNIDAVILSVKEKVIIYYTYNIIVLLYHSIEQWWLHLTYNILLHLIIHLPYLPLYIGVLIIP